jgi:hypothetical protein
VRTIEKRYRYLKDLWIGFSPPAKRPEVIELFRDGFQKPPAFIPYMLKIFNGWPLGSNPPKIRSLTLGRGGGGKPTGGILKVF